METSSWRVPKRATHPIRGRPRTPGPRPRSPKRASREDARATPRCGCPPATRTRGEGVARARGRARRASRAGDARFARGRRLGPLGSGTRSGQKRTRRGRRPRRVRAPTSTSTSRPSASGRARGGTRRARARGANAVRHGTFAGDASGPLSARRDSTGQQDQPEEMLRTLFLSGQTTDFARARRGTRRWRASAWWGCTRPRACASMPTATGARSG